MTAAETRPAGVVTPTGTEPDVVPPAVPETTAPPPDRRRWAAFVIMTVATFMDMLDGSVVNVALPAIQRDLGLSFGSLQWVTAGYVLAFALFLITGGRLGDIWGRRKMFQLGVAGFTLASLACGLAVDPYMIIGSRLLQGAMAGLMVPQVLSIIHVTFPDKEKGTVFAIHGLVGGVAAAIAPLIGGVIVAADVFGLDWRPVFLVNVPVGVIGFVLGMKYIPNSKSSGALRLDLVGVLLSAAALLMLLVPLTFGRELGWPIWSIVVMVASVAVLGLFVRYERRKHARDGSPLVALDLFRARSFSAALGLTLACFAFTGMFMLALYLYLQLGLGWTPLRTGVSLLAFALGAFVSASVSVVVLVPKFGRTVVQGGDLTMALGLGVFLLINAGAGADATSWGIAPALFLTGLGFGATATPLTLFGLSDVPMKDAGSASGLINTMLQLGFAVGIAVASLSFFAPLPSAAADSVDRQVPQLRQELVAAGVPARRADVVVNGFRACTVDRLAEPNPVVDPASCAVASTAPRPGAESAAVARVGDRARGETFSEAFQVALWTGLGMIGVSLLLAGLLPRRLRAPEGAH